MDRQRKKLMRSIGMAVKGLRTPDEIMPVVEQLGEKHADYGVRQEHSATVREALLWALEQGRESAFAPDVRDAWATVDTLVSGVLLNAVHAVVTEAEAVPARA